MEEKLEKLENFFLKLLEKIRLKKMADLYREHREGMRYLIFGALATVVNIVVFWICSYFIFNSLPEAQRVSISNSISIVVAVVFAYITNKLFVFESKTNSFKELFREIASFTGCRIITAVVDMGVMQLLVVSMKWNDMLAKIIVQIIVILLNFIFSKLIIFKKKK